MKENFEKHIYVKRKIKKENIVIKICGTAIAQAKFYLIAACKFFLINYIK